MNQVRQLHISLSKEAFVGEFAILEGAVGLDVASSQINPDPEYSAVPDIRVSITMGDESFCPPGRQPLLNGCLLVLKAYFGTLSCPVCQSRWGCFHT